MYNQLKLFNEETIEEDNIEIICRFSSQKDIDVFNNKNGLKINKDTIFVHLPEKKIINKQKKIDFFENNQINIFDFINDEIDEIQLGKDYYNLHWKQMPEFEMNFKTNEYAKIVFKISKMTLQEISNLFEQKITDKTKSIWFPKLIPGSHRNLRVLGGRKAKYPIYIVSKNRSNEYRFHTSNWLSRMCQEHYICVEPDDYENYKNSILNESPYCSIIIMDMIYKQKYNCLGNIGNINSTGPGAARNFCADHAKNNGFDWCWILDDNSENFDRYWRGRRILSHSSEVFRSCEEFCERYENIGIAGLNYSKFCVGENVYPPFVTNTRIYSYGLWNLKCPYIMQEGRYNEDTIQSLNILKKGWCTVQFNCYLGAKVTTQKIKGGNTEEFYSKDEGGTLPKSQMLVNIHPDVSKLVWKFHRWHHEVDYKRFKQELIIKKEYKYLLDEKNNNIQENGTYIVRIPNELCLSEYDNREYLEKMFPKGCKNDVTNSDLFLVGE